MTPVIRLSTGSRPRLRAARPKLIVANWKMNPASYGEAEALLTAVLVGVRGVRGVEVVIAPPFPWLTPLLQKVFALGFRNVKASEKSSVLGNAVTGLTDFSHKTKGVSFGAQDVFWEGAGAYTGEVSPAMLKTARVTHVIVGHSERRRWLGETDEMVSRKVRAALTAGLTVIVCVGEQSREADDVERVLDGQVRAAFRDVPRNYLERLVVAYEPVWAIGTGVADSPNDALSAAISIRKTIRELSDQKTAAGVRVLYGGSVTAANAGAFLREAGIDGALVGGASLRAEEFASIVRLAASPGGD